MGGNYESRKPFNGACSVDDAAEADKIFDMLMVDKVEPRRELSKKMPCIQH